jgi:S-adenosylmethionine-dependent methyltransferase
MQRPRLSLRPLPAHLAARYRALGERERAALAEALDAHYFAGCEPGYLASEPGRRDRDDHLFRRQDVARAQVVPWLDAASPLEGARVLELGCGTGSATVALAEQGARVTGVDLCERSLAVARRRCELHGVDASCVLGNAVEVLEKQRGERFDLILFYASLEHMTHEERKQALRRAWQLLCPGSLLGVVETPNRLWHYDSHTSFLPFFHWLPDDLAFEYSSRSPVLSRA